MASTTIEKFRGLTIQPNSMDEEPGSFESFENVVRIYDKIVTSRRGFSLDREFTDGQEINLMFEYQANVFFVSQNRLYRGFTPVATAQAAITNGSPTITITKTAHGLTTGDFVNNFFVADTELAFYAAFPNRYGDFYGSFPVSVTGANTFTITAVDSATANVTTGATAASYEYYFRATGQTVAVTASGVERSRALEASKNAYFLTDNGPLKLERNDLPVLKAGIPQGLDMGGLLGLSTQGANTGPIKPNSQVAYRVLFGRRDANMNLVLGAPSEILILINSKFSASGVSYASPTLTITYAGHGLATNDIIQIFNIAGTGTLPPDRTQFLVTVLTANTFTITFTGATGIPTTVTAIDYGIFKTPRVFFSIPSEIQSTEYIYQVYRTVESNSQTTVPTQRFQLVTEENVTTAQAAAGFVSFTDEIPTVLIQGAAELYTNVDTQEGELQANSRPPFAKDFALYKGRVIYANTKSYQALELAVVAPKDFQNGTTVVIAGQTFVFRKNAANNDAVVNEVATSPATRVASTVTVTQVNHGYINNDTIYVLESVTLAVTAGIYTVTSTGANTFTFTSVGAGVTGTITYEGRQNGSSQWLVKAYDDTISGTTTTTSQAIDGTARSLVKATNRFSAGNVYAQYISGISDIPGKMLFSAKNLSASSFTATISVLADGEGFFPSLPTSGTTVSSVADTIINQLMISKFNEPEGVPLINTALVGSGNKAILRVATLRDSLIVIKEDGVFRLTGDDPQNYSVIPIDVTVFCKAKNSVAVLNNSVFCLSNQGVVQITDNSAQIVSRDIEPLLSAIINKTMLSDTTSAFSYESDREYVLATIKPSSNSSVPDVVYVFNYLTNAWSIWDTYFNNGSLIPIADSAYYVATDKNRILRERKDSTKKDFTGQEFAVPIYKGKIGAGTAVIGNPDISVTLDIEHNLSIGQIITVESVDVTISGAFSGGVADVTGQRLVSAVTDPNTFTYTAATSAISNATGGFVQYAEWLSEISLAAASTNGSTTVTLTSTQPHQLSTGVGVNINSSQLSTAFPLASNITGFKTVTVTSPTTFTVQALAGAASSQSATLNITDRRQNYYYVTLKPLQDITPEIGDCIIYGNVLYKIIDLFAFSVTRYLVRLNYSALFASNQAPFLYSFFRKTIKFAPLTLGDSGKLKDFSVFQAQFRREGNCTALEMDYACDTKATTGMFKWVDRVGTDQAQITFSGYGEIAWGDDPWGEGESIERDYTTGPAVILRTFVNGDASQGTFLQPVLVHKVAGEEINLQSITIDYQNVSTTSSR